MSSIRGSEGDLGSPKPGGVAAADAFTKRENALETQYIRQREMEKLKVQSDKLVGGQSKSPPQQGGDKK